MEPRVEQKAKDLAKAVAESNTYANLKAAREGLEKHSAAQIMLRDIQQRQEKLQEKSRSGEEITQKEIEQFQQLSQVAAMNPYVRKLIDAEMEFNAMFTDIQVMLAKAVGINVEDQALEEPEAETFKEDEPPAKSRLWVPGQK